MVSLFGHFLVFFLFRDRLIQIQSLFQVKKAFEYAYSILTNVVYPLSSYNDCNRQSILGRIVRVSDKVVQHRRRIEEGTRTTLMGPPQSAGLVGTTQSKPSRSSSTGSTSSAEESGGSSEVRVETGFWPYLQYHEGL